MINKETWKRMEKKTCTCQSPTQQRINTVNMYQQLRTLSIRKLPMQLTENLKTKFFKETQVANKYMKKNLNITSHQEDTNPNHHEIPPDPHQN